MDFSNYTIEKMDELNKKSFKDFTESDYNKYLARNKELGREYEVGGKQKYINVGKPYYACGSKVIENDEKGRWVMGIMAAGPGFDEYPRAVDKETFVKTMLNLGAPKEKIDEFIEYEIDWNNF